MIESRKNGSKVEGSIFTGWRGLHRVKVDLLGDALAITNTRLFFPDRRLHKSHREEGKNLETTSIRPHWHPFGRRIRFSSVQR